jgi:hypothetical protein
MVAVIQEEATIVAEAEVQVAEAEVPEVPEVPDVPGSNGILPGKKDHQQGCSI